MNRAVGVRESTSRSCAGNWADLLLDLGTDVDIEGAVGVRATEQLNIAPAARTCMLSAHCIARLPSPAP